MNRIISDKNNRATARLFFQLCLFFKGMVVRGTLFQNLFERIEELCSSCDQEPVIISVRGAKLLKE
jgi:hypothetical protein